MPREAAVLKGARLECGVRGARLVKLNPTNGNGEPDLLVCHRGRTIAAELKQPGAHASKIQRHRLEQWAAAGAIVGVIESRADMARLLDIAERHPAPNPTRW